MAGPEFRRRGHQLQRWERKPITFAFFQSCIKLKKIERERHTSLVPPLDQPLMPACIQQYGIIKSIQ